MFSGRYCLRRLRRISRSLVARSGTQSRRLCVFGIETSCDDTSVCMIEQTDASEAPTILSHHTARCINESEKFGGIHPDIAMQSQSRNIGPLVSRVLHENKDKKIDLVAATRGPGMNGSLAQGLNTGKGLALGLGCDFIGVHHMQAHALTPRLLSAAKEPTFPYLSLLLSGGHTMLVLSTSITSHEILLDTEDVAIGDYLDKVARSLKIPWHGQMPAAALEKWSFDGNYERSPADGRWNIPEPLTVKPKHAGAMFFTFGGLGSCIDRLVSEQVGPLSADDLKSIGRQAQRLAFQHVLRRSMMVLKKRKAREHLDVRYLVCSGGVARNNLLRRMIHGSIQQSGYEIKPIFPPVELCVDNAVMIAWAGLEMYKLGYTTEWAAQRERIWPIDNVLGVEGWQHTDVMMGH